MEKRIKKLENKLNQIVKIYEVKITNNNYGFLHIDLVINSGFEKYRRMASISIFEFFRVDCFLHPINLFSEREIRKIILILTNFSLECLKEEFKC